MFDLVVLGGGPAGVTAALRARELGASVALIEKGRLGGTCTNDGCVPTRVLAKAARLMRESRQFSDYGLYLETPPQVDFAAVIRRTQQVVYQVHEKKQLLDHLKDVQVMTYAEAGDTHFVDAYTVELADGTQIQGAKFVICVGGSARRLPFPGGDHALTHSDVWTMKELPERVAIVGGGATGCQLASIFDDFGAQVTLLDIAPRILPAEDEAVSSAMAAEFERHGMRVLTGIDGIDRIDAAEKGYSLVYRENGVEQQLPVSAVVMAVGWPGNTDGLGLDAAGVERDRSYIRVNDHMQTSVPHIFAAGDITGKMLLVQSAGYQAQVAVENALLGLDQHATHKLVPHGGFTDPEYGSVGLTEAQASEAHDYLVATVPYADLDRAVIDGHTTGFCKLLVDRDSHLILGAHVVGEQAVEVVQIVAAGMASGMRVEQLADLELAYPTFSAIVGLAARQLVRELGAVPVAPAWRAIQEPRPTEWERKDS